MAAKRLRWLDGVRGLAIGWVLFVHAITIFTPNGNADFPGFWGLLFYGISGKLAVACCCVILGYFASESRHMRFIGYAIKRSLPFMLQILLIEAIYYLLSVLLGPDSYLSSCSPALLEPVGNVLKTLLKDTFLISADLLPTFWCINDFVFGSLLVYAMQMYLNKRTPWLSIAITLLAIILLYFLDLVWISACVMGYLLRLLLQLELKIAKHPILWILLLLPIPWLIRRGECDLTYFYDGIACLLLIYVLFQWTFSQKLFAFPPLAFLGTITLEVFMLHVPIFELLRSLLNPVYLRFSLNTLHHTLLIIPAMLLSIGAAWLWKRYVTPPVAHLGQRLAIRIETIPNKSNN